MRSIPLVWVLLAVVLGWGCGVTAADAPMAGPQKPKVDPIEFSYVKVVAFKDGNCLIIKHGVGTTDANGELYTEEVPDSAILGSFWAAPKEGQLLSLTAGYIPTTTRTTAETTCLTPLDILRANEGQECTVTLTDKTEYRGTIRAVLTKAIPVTAEPGLAPLVPPAMNNADPAEVNYRWSSRMAYPPLDTGAQGTERTTVDQPQGTLFVLRTADGDRVLPVGEVRSVLLKEATLKTSVTTTTEKLVKRLTFKFAAAGQRQEFEMMYFTPGMRWIPTYRMDLPPNGAAVREAKLALQAEILNEVEDLKAVPIDLVVGVPNIRFKDTASPLTLETTIRNVLSRAADNNFMLNRQMSNASFGNDRLPAAAPGAAAPGEMQALMAGEIMAGSTQDLFVYSLPKMTLMKGERAAVPVFTTTVAYRDLYLWNIETDPEAEDGARRRGASSPSAGPVQFASNNVWHTMELSNGSQLPWTTGPVMVLQGGRPIAQELLPYTPVKGASLVQLTVAVDLVPSYGEEETGRKAQFINWRGYWYDRIDRKGTLRLTNRKAEAVQVRITRSLLGRAVQASDNGTITVGTQLRLQDLNPDSTVTWGMDLAPGATLERTFAFEYLIAH